MTNQDEVLSTIIQAPTSFKSRNTPPTGLDGTIDAFFNGMVIIKTRMGEVILKLLHASHIQAGIRVFLHHDKDSDMVRISTVKKVIATPVTSSVNFKDEVRVRPTAATLYRPTNDPMDKIKGHHIAAEATLDSAIYSASKENAFDVARSMCLLPDLDRNRGAISIMTFLLVSLTRGKLKAWSGMNSTGNTSWDHVMMERVIDGPDTKKWKTRQFPINLSDKTLWAIFATPEENAGPVSRFLVEVSTRTFGLVQVKAFGQGSTCEIIVTSHSALSDEIQNKCRAAVENVAVEIDAEIDVSFVSDPAMLANLSQARRTVFEA